VEMLASSTVSALRLVLSRTVNITISELLRGRIEILANGYHGTGIEVFIDEVSWIVKVMDPESNIMSKKSCMYMSK
jgi:hypothetical protein